MAQTPSADVDQALTVLLRAVVNPALAQACEALHNTPLARIQHCIQQMRIEASEGASLVASCAPHGRAMLSQAQQTLERLESLEILACRTHGPSGSTPP